MKLKKGMITEEANGEFVAVATGEASKSFNGLIRNNATADFIFRQLETDKTETQIVDAMLEKYDLPLYRRPNGKYVLHRILKVRKNDYIICGDNRIRRETVPHEWIIGVVSGYYKGKKFISVKDRKYLLYVHIWCDFYYVRAALLWLKSAPARIKRKLKRKG